MRVPHLPVSHSGMAWGIDQLRIGGVDGIDIGKVFVEIGVQSAGNNAPVMSEPPRERSSAFGVPKNPGNTQHWTINGKPGSLIGSRQYRCVVIGSSPTMIPAKFLGSTKWAVIPTWFTNYHQPGVEAFAMSFEGGHQTIIWVVSAGN